MESRLCCHRGAKVVSLQDLEAIPTPERTSTWNPIPHHVVVH